MEPISNLFEEDLNDLVLIDPEDLPEVEMGYMEYLPPEPEEHPVAGWLVSLTGPDRGESFPVRVRRQLSIGRETDNDIVIDNPRVEDYHAGIIYDPMNNNFFVFTEDNTLLNGKPVEDSAELHHHDILEFGNAKFMFVPLCDELFNWNEDSSFCHP